jgi:hypothetical protein
MAGKKYYRSSQGKSVDLGALLLQNETVRAVGNMGVNARGDRIDTGNKVIDTKVKQAQRAYNKQIGPQDDIPQSFAPPPEGIIPTQPVAPDPYELQSRNTKEDKLFKEQRKANKKTTKVAKTKTVVKTPTTPVPELKAEPKAEPVVDINDLNNIESNLDKVEETKALPKGGLADAIARAKTIKQEALKTPRQQAQEKSGVRKI